MDEKRQGARTGEPPGLIGWLCRPFVRRRAARHLEERAWALYGQVVQRARRPALYSELGVPDTVEGRFEMIQLHVALLTLRLRETTSRGRPLAQALFDVMMTDMDRSLRELAVGDLSVGKYIKRMAQSFYFRLQHLERSDPTAPALVHMLERNIYPGQPDASAKATRLAAALAREAEHLWQVPEDELLAGRLTVPGQVLDLAP